MNDYYAPYYKEYKKRSAMLELVRPADEVYAFINEQLELHERYMKLMRENAPDEEYEKFDSPFWRDNVRKFVGEEFWQASHLEQYDYALRTNADVWCRMYEYYYDIFRAMLKCELEENDRIVNAPLVLDRQHFVENWDAANIRFLKYVADHNITKDEYWQNYAYHVYTKYYIEYCSYVNRTPPSKEMAKNREREGEIPSLDRIHYNNWAHEYALEIVNSQYTNSRDLAKGANANGMIWDKSFIPKKEENIKWAAFNQYEFMANPRFVDLLERLAADKGVTLPEAYEIYKSGKYTPIIISGS